MCYFMKHMSYQHFQKMILYDLVYYTGFKFSKKFWYCTVSMNLAIETQRENRFLGIK